MDPWTLSVESRKSWRRRETLAIFSYFLPIIFKVSFAGNTFGCGILRQNSEGAHTSHKCPISGRAGGGFEHPGLVKSVPDHDREAGMR